MFNSKEIANLIILTGIVLCFGHCWADTNLPHFPMCTQSENCTINDTTSYNNLVSLWNSLAKVGPSHNGFYNTTIGNGSDAIYGVAQCRGDIPPGICSNCIEDAIERAKRCNGTKCAVSYFTWCYVQYTSVTSFGYGRDYSSTFKNSSISDDPAVASQGFNFMSRLASLAAQEPLMFKYDDLDLGQYGKRYGMAQCSRDINTSACSDCLQGRLETWARDIIGQGEWQIYSPRCSMWYSDYPISYNVTRPSQATPSDASTATGLTRFLAYGQAVSYTITVVLALPFVL